MRIEALGAFEECLAVGEELRFQIICVSESSGVNRFDGVVLGLSGFLCEVATGDGARPVALGAGRLRRAGRVAVTFPALGVTSG